MTATTNVPLTPHRDRDLALQVRLAIIRSPHTERDVAARAGVSPLNLVALLAGRRVFRLDDVFRIAEALDMKPSELLQAAGH
ncbi:helix-turn-helix domain-containing protein [Demequina sp. B12]|uniref:helix-turn-helix domain-containing protein n=1 Tax=Demequina sp. B12 TaxID=2992757 RepID=UPI00237B8150|nr:helix-turn-helix transcriptional regulator [Demequina sp. B12]MDE0571888.1 helix-turn-helix domain-containing protein [Demequina sp. B12]